MFVQRVLSDLVSDGHKPLTTISSISGATVFLFPTFFFTCSVNAIWTLKAQLLLHPSRLSKKKLLFKVIIYSRIQ